MLLYGFHPVREALRHRPHEIQRVLVAARPGGRRQEIEELARRHRVSVSAVPRAHLDALVDESVHNGFAVELAGKSEDRGSGDPNFVVLVEDIQDPRNLGALLRVCEGAGVGRVLVRDRGSAPLSPAVAKASAGASEYLPVERITNTAQELRRLKEAGFWVYGTAAGPGGQPPWKLDLKGPVCLVFGGEEKGMRRLTTEHCDGLVALPMRGQVGSLNLSTAAAAILYEAVRQRS